MVEHGQGGMNYMIINQLYVLQTLENSKASFNLRWKSVADEDF